MCADHIKVQLIFQKEVKKLKLICNLLGHLDGKNNRKERILFFFKKKMGGLIIYSNVVYDFNANIFLFFDNRKEFGEYWFEMHFYRYALDKSDEEKFISSEKYYEGDIEELNWYFDNKI